MKGVEQLRSKLPALEGPKIFLLPLTALVGLSSGLFFLAAMDIISRRVPSNQLLFALEPLMPVIGGLTLGGISNLLISGLWRNRVKAIRKYGTLAYQKLIPRGLVGVVFVGSIALHSFLSVRSIVETPPVNSTTTLLSQSVLSILGVPTIFDVALRIALSIPIVILAALAIRSSLLTFGIDYMMVVYLFFPEESEFQENEIYSIIRHPTYFSGILLVFGGFLLRMSFYSFAFVMIAYFVFRIHLYFEEGELIERFGDSYRQYMKNVGGLCVKPKDARAFLRFALRREQ